MLKSYSDSRARLVIMLKSMQLLQYLIQLQCQSYAAMSSVSMLSQFILMNYGYNLCREKKSIKYFPVYLNSENKEYV